MTRLMQGKVWLVRGVILKKKFEAGCEYDSNQLDLSVIWSLHKTAE